MPRASRIVVPGIPYNITQRGNRRVNVFFSDGDQDAYGKGFPNSWGRPSSFQSERNPVRAGLAEKAATYPRSSAAGYCGLRADVLAPDTGDLTEQVGDWRGFLEKADTPEETDRLPLHTGTGRPLGGIIFLNLLESVLNRSVRSRKAGRPRKERTSHENRGSVPIFPEIWAPCYSISPFQCRIYKRSNDAHWDWSAAGKHFRLAYDQTKPNGGPRFQDSFCALRKYCSEFPCWLLLDTPGPDGYDSDAAERHEERHVDQYQEIVDALPLLITSPSYSVCSMSAQEATNAYQAKASVALQLWYEGVLTLLGNIRCTVLEREAWLETASSMAQSFENNIGQKYPGLICSEPYNLAPNSSGQASHCPIIPDLCDN